MAPLTPTTSGISKPEALPSLAAAEDKGQKAIELLRKLIVVIEAPDCLFAMAAFVADVKQFLRTIKD